MSEGQKVQWDAVKFFTTLNTFGEIPFLGSFRWIQEWLGQREIFSGRVLNAMKDRILVIKDTSSASPSALFEALTPLLLSTNELLLCDFSSNNLVNEQPVMQADTATTTKSKRHRLNELMLGADTIILQATSDFSTLWADLVKHLSKNSEVVVQPVFDFAQTDADLAAWGALDDVVMGGVSQGTFVFKKQMHLDMSSLDLLDEPAQYALFIGSVSTENSGGFSSVRTQNFEPPFSFAGWTGLRLLVKGDGQRYKFILRNRADWDSPGYIYSFDTQAGVWLDVDVPFAELVPTFRAKSISEAAPFDDSKTVSFQIMLSKFEYDRRLNPNFTPGPFELAVAKVEAYRTRRGVPLIVVGSEDETVRARQQISLNESEVPCKWVEPGDAQAVATAVSVLLAG